MTPEEIQAERNSGDANRLMALCEKVMRQCVRDIEPRVTREEWSQFVSFLASYFVNFRPSEKYIEEGWAIFQRYSWRELEQVAVVFSRVDQTSPVDWGGIMMTIDRFRENGAA